MVHWYPKMGAVKESGRSQQKIFPRASTRISTHTSVQPPHQKISSYAPDWCLERCRLRSQTLHIFMDAFQGSYRTEPHDMRFFSAFYLLVRISILIQTMLFPSTLKLFTSGILSLASAGVVAIFQPYKVKGHNTMDSIWMLLMGGYFISYHEVLILTALGYGKQWVLAAVINVLSIVCLLIMLVFLMVWIIASSWIKAVVRKIMSKLGWLTLHHHINGSGCDEVIESFDRDIG